MSGEVDRRAVVAEGSAALADLTQTYHEAVGAVVALVRAQTGVELLPTAQPSVMDATREQLKDAAGRARLALQALDPVLRVTWGDATTLGELIREPFWTDEERERMAELLTQAGLS